MGLFKNEVGRPPNEILKKRKIIYASIALVCVLLVGAGVLYFKGFFGGGEISGKSKNAALACAQPYDIKLCENEGYYGRAHGQSIQKLQELLKKAGYHYGYVNGNYGSYTVDAVKRAQKAFGLSQTGKADYKLVEKLAPKYGYGYTVITYNKAGGTGTVLGTIDNKEFVMAANTPVSSSIIAKNGATHIGWTATAVSKTNSSKKYYYGCNSKNCTAPTMYTQAQKDSLGTKFVPYVYSPSENVNASKFNAKDNVNVEFSAYYCSATGAKYNKSTSSCSKGTAGNGTTEKIISRYTATFNINGAKAISNTSQTCDVTSSSKTKSCTVTLPTITVNAGDTVIGWSDNKNATTATYKVGTKVTLTGNKTFYAIAKRKLVASFVKNTAKSIGATSKECFAYGASGCNVTSPTITATSGYVVLGWSRDPNGRKNGIIGANKSMNLTSSTTYYAITNNLLVKFPDEELRKCVLSAYKKRFLNTNNLVDLTDDQLKTFTALDCYYYNNIKDATGIKYLTNLEKLNLYSNKLQSIDVSANTKLTNLDVGYNQISKIDVSKNTALVNLEIHNNQLTSLDVSKNTNLQELNAGNNKLTGLNVSNNRKLTFLGINNSSISSIDVSNNTLLEILNANDNKISKINVTKNTKLKALQINRTNITSLDIKKNTKLETLYASNCKLTSIDTSSNPELKELYIEYNQITSLNLSNNKKLVTLEANHNKISSLVASTSPDLSRISLQFNQLKSMNVTKNTKLSYLQIASNQLTSLDLSKNPNLTSVNVTSNKLSALNLNLATSLKSLYAGQNQLTSINITNCSKLEELFVTGNKLASLDVTKSTELRTLQAITNNLTSINVTKNTKLVRLELGNNQLTSIDLSKNLELAYLSIYNNKLKSLDVSKNTKLTTLYSHGNGLKLSDIKIGNNKNLKISNG